MPSIFVSTDGGAHVPVIPFIDVTGKAIRPLFWHSGPIVAKAGVICISILISIVIDVAPHCPASGINV
jgi:hypothetical protein